MRSMLLTAESKQRSSWNRCWDSGSPTGEVWRLVSCINSAHFRVETCTSPSHGMFSGFGTATPVWFCFNLPCIPLPIFFANFIMYLFYCLFLVALDLHCGVEALSNFGNWDYSLVAVYRFLVAVVSLFGTHRLSICVTFPAILIPSWYFRVFKELQSWVHISQR